MKSGPYFMGIDGGTESVRVGVFDQEGTPIGFASSTYALKHPHPGWAEQEPADWWSSLVRAVREGVPVASGQKPTLRLEHRWLTERTARLLLR